MSYNLARRVLRAEKKEFVTSWKKKNKVSDQSIAKYISNKNKKMSLENQYEAILEITFNALQKQAEAAKTPSEEVI
jgi:hypothetical protein